MRLALISLVDYCAPSADDRTGKDYIGFAGLYPLAEGNIILSQMDLAAKWGAEEIICVVEQIMPELADLEDYARALGLRFVMVRSVADISVRLGGDDALLVLADGLYLSPEHRSDIIAQKGSFIACFSPGDNDAFLVEQCERIDINHHWAGVLVMKGSELFDVRDLPADWDVQSAILRIAVQRDVAKIGWPMAYLEDFQLGYPARYHISKGREGHAPQIALKNMADDFSASLSRNGKGLFSLILGSRIGRMLGMSLWRMDAARILLRLFAVIMPLAAAALGFFGYIIPGLVLLAAGRGFYAVERRFFGNFSGFSDAFPDHILHFGLSAIALLCLVMRGSPTGHGVDGIYAALMVLGLNGLLRGGIAMPNFIGKVMVSHIVFLAVALVPLLPGWILYWTMIWSLMMLGYLIYNAFQPAPSRQSAGD